MRPPRHVWAITVHPSRHAVLDMLLYAFAISTFNSISSSASGCQLPVAQSLRPRSQAQDGHLSYWTFSANANLCCLQRLQHMVNLPEDCLGDEAPQEFANHHRANAAVLLVQWYEADAAEKLLNLHAFTNFVRNSRVAAARMGLRSSWTALTCSARSPEQPAARPLGAAGYSSGGRIFNKCRTLQAPQHIRINNSAA